MNEASAPVISVVTTTFNRGHLLPRVWRSLRDETPPFEWIVIDDASNDDTTAVVQSFADDRIRYVRHTVNRGGPAEGRNEGARMSLGRYVLFLDDDDELYPGALERMVETMDSADTTIGCAIFQCLFPGGRRWREHVEHRAVYDETDVVCRRVLGLEKICVYRREVFDEFHLEEDLKFVEGVFVFGITRRHKILMMDEPGRIYHDSGVRQTDSSGMIRISPLIARGYERILANHREVLADYPGARLHYLTHALFRYAVAGHRADSWRVFKEILELRRVKGAGFAFVLLLLSLSGAGPLVERIRLPLMARRRIIQAEA